MGVGGIESMVMSYYRAMDKNKITVDFVFFGEGDGLYDAEILANGSRIFHLPVKSRHYFKSVRAMKTLLNTERYDVVHANLNAAGIYSALKLAKQCGIPIRISHAHSTNHGTQNKLRWRINDFARKRIIKVSTHNFACSDLAGKWYYGTEPFTVVHNAIDTKKYIFNQTDRQMIRQQMHVQEGFIVGHVGNLGYPKNQAFLIEIFSKLAEKCDRAELWLVGEGEDEARLKEKVKALQLERKIKFLGQRSDVAMLLQGMDVFVLPSFFEGFPVVIAEAVAADLPCVVSDTITRMVLLSEKVEMLALNASLDRWAEKILSYQHMVRGNRYQQIVQKGFDIITEAKRLENFYQNGRFQQ